MTFRTWIRNLFDPRPSPFVSGKRTAGQLSARARRLKLELEVLEDRLAPAAFVVTDGTDNVADTGSIRYAINHLAAGANSITFSPTLAAQTILLTGGHLLISQSVSITGLGADQLSLSGGGSSRILYITAGTVQISGLTFKSGMAGFGGAIYNAGALTLTGDVFSANSAQGYAGAPGNAGGGGGAGLGGAIYNDGNLTLLASTLSGNLAAGGLGGNGTTNYGAGGGGGGTLGAGQGSTGGAGGGGNSSVAGGFGAGGGGGTWRNGNGGAGGFGGGGGGGSGYGGGGAGGTFGGAGGHGISFRRYHGNFFSHFYSYYGYGSGGGGGAGMGGAVFNNTNAFLTITNSTLTANTAQGGQGGSHTSNGNFGAAGLGVGGGVLNNGGIIHVNNSTLFANRADSGGGVYDNTGPITVDSSIIFNNSATNSPDVFGGGFLDSGYNFIFNTSGGAGFTAATDFIGINPLLMPLGNYGGATQTMALRAGSLALNNGDPNSAVTTDQRGAQRGSTGINSGIYSDIGAYEASSSYQVTSTVDSTAVGTLRGAVSWADTNNNPLLVNLSPNVIRFDTAGTFLTPQTITLGLGQLRLSNTVTPTTINGTGVNNLTLSGNDANRVLMVNSTVTGSLSALTITKGSAPSYNLGYYGIYNSPGGGLSNFGTLTLDNVAVTQSHAYQGGGLINHPGASLTITNSTVANNTASNSAQGGGIWNAGTLLVTASTLTGNTAGQESALSQFVGSTTFVESTITGNTATVFPGAIGGQNGSITILSSTVANNTRTGLFSNGATLSVKNSIVAGNTLGDISDPSNGFISQGHNLIGDNSGAGFLASDLRNTDPLLGALADNGGLTQTMALLSGSPAMNHGDNNGIPAYDQRGPGYARIINGTADIGAFETQVVPPISVTIGAVSASPRTVIAGQTLSSVIAFVASLNTYTRAGDLQAAVTWGDGATTGGIINGPTGGPFSITGTHTYAQAGTDSASITVTNVNAPAGGTNASSSASFAFTVTPGASTTAPGATHLLVIPSATSTAGTAFSVTVTALDPFNQIVTNYPGTVHFSSGDGQAILPAADGVLTNGVSTFQVTLKTPGTQTITVNDSGSAAISGSGTSFVSAATANHFTLSAPPGATAGTSFNFTVSALDPYGNTATGYGGSIHFTSTDANALLPAVLPATVTLNHGVGTFPATLFNAGNRTITASDNTISGATANILVNPTADPTFTVSAQPGAIAGTPTSFTVTAHDEFGNTATLYGGNVHFTSSDPQFVALADAMLTNGTGSFMATLKTAGNQTITVTDTLRLDEVGRSGAIAVSALAATHFGVSAQASATAGAQVNVTVTALDPYGNTDAGYSGLVHFTTGAASSGLPADIHLTSGVGSASANLNTAGSQTLTATQAGGSSPTGTSASIIISAAGADHFAVTASSPVTAGSALLVTVTAQDVYNNTAAGYTGTVHFTSSDSSAVLPTDTTLTSGAGMFLATLKTAGGKSIAATDHAITGSVNVTVEPGSATHFGVFPQIFGNAVTGTAFSVNFTALDAYANGTNHTGTVHFSSSDKNAILPGDISVFGGTGSFNATLSTVGNQTLTVMDRTSPFINGTSAPVAARGLAVTSVLATADGFTVAFNKAFVPADLALYGPTLARQADVILFGSGGVGSIHGTLVFNSTNTGFTFKGTSSYIQLLNSFNGFDSAALPDATYTVTLVSGSGGKGFLDALNAGLDGFGNGTIHNFSTTFATHYQANLTPVLSIPDFARGPDDTKDIVVPNDHSRGIPITLYNASNVTDVTFTLASDSNLLQVNATAAGAGTDAMDPAGTFTMNTDVLHGLTSFAYHNATPHSGTIVLGDILARVPSTAKTLYQAKQELYLGTITINGGLLPTGVINADGIQVNDYFADANGDHNIDGLDKLLLDSVAQGKATGFSHFAQADPVIVGDLGSNAQVDPASVAGVDTYTAATPPGNGQRQIPVPPGLTGFSSPNAADPTLSLSQTSEVYKTWEVSGEPMGVSPQVTVLLDDAHPAGSTGLTEAMLALRYDPTVLTVSASDISLGTIPTSGSGWQIYSVVIDQTRGEIGIELYSATPITGNQRGSLVTIGFHAHRGAAASGTSVQLVDSVRPLGDYFATLLADDQSALILTPGLVDKVFAELAL